MAVFIGLRVVVVVGQQLVVVHTDDHPEDEQHQEDEQKEVDVGNHLIPTRHLVLEQETYTKSR